MWCSFVVWRPKIIGAETRKQAASQSLVASQPCPTSQPITENQFQHHSQILAGALPHILRNHRKLDDHIANTSTMAHRRAQYVPASTTHTFYPVNRPCEGANWGRGSGQKWLTDAAIQVQPAGPHRHHSSPERCPRREGSGRQLCAAAVGIVLHWGPVPRLQR